jgi:hypothetical protein
VPGYYAQVFPIYMAVIVYVAVRIPRHRRVRSRIRAKTPGNPSQVLAIHFPIAIHVAGDRNLKPPPREVVVRGVSLTCNRAYIETQTVIDILI